MPCYFPLQATFSFRDDGKKAIKFSNVNSRLFYKGINPVGDNNLTLPCGRCMGCRLEKSRQWAVRCLHEAKCYDDNCFVTLTFSDEHLPKDGSLCRKHVQDFLKRLRSKLQGSSPRALEDGGIDYPIRVFYCGEYGDQLGRPHYHLCLFNLDFKDRVKLYKVNNFWYYSSDTLSSLWTFGHSVVCDFSFETAAYVARYCTKKVTGARVQEHYQGRVPEFAGMSLKPGIGKTWFDKFAESDLFFQDNVVVRGAECKPPRYYDILRERQDPDGFAKAKEARRLLGEENASNSTFKRLAVRLKCLEARTKLLIRRLER